MPVSKQLTAFRHPEIRILIFSVISPSLRMTFFCVPYVRKAISAGLLKIILPGIFPSDLSLLKICILPFCISITGI